MMIWQALHQSSVPFQAPCIISHFSCADFAVQRFFGSAFPNSFSLHSPQKKLNSEFSGGDTLLTWFQFSFVSTPCKILLPLTLTYCFFPSFMSFWPQTNCSIPSPLMILNFCSHFPFPVLSPQFLGFTFFLALTIFSSTLISNSSTPSGFLKWTKIR